MALHLFNSNNDDDHLQEDWTVFTKAAGHLARDVGSSLFKAIKVGGSKIKDFVSNKLLPEDQQEEEFTSFGRQIVDDTEDEELFRGIIGNSDQEDEGDHVAIPFIPMTESIDRIMEDAARFLRDDERATSLLGSPLHYGPPFSESKSSSTTVNGEKSSSVQASFNVWGSKGQAIATVIAKEGNLESVDLEMNGLVYRLTAPAASNVSVVFDEEDEDALEVEVMVGMRGRSRYNGRVLDAEIIDKTFQ